MTEDSKTQSKFKGFRSPNYTMVPDELFDELLAVLSGAEIKVLLYIMRRTFGFKKGSDRISKAQLERGIQRNDGTVLDRGTGLSRRAIRLAIDSLIERNILLKQSYESPERGHEAAEYALNIIRSTSDTPWVQSTPPLGTKVPKPMGTKVPPQQTVLQEKDKQHVVVVDALRKFGVSASVATMLAGKYPEGIIFQKLELVQWLLETKSPLVTKNPAGYLRRAIEEDYAPPRGYKTQAQRGTEEEGQRQVVLASQEERLRSEVELAQAKEHAQQRLREQYPPQRIDGTDLTTEGAWDLVLDRLKNQMTKANFETWIKETSLIHLDGSMARVAAASKFQIEWLVSRFDPWIRRELSSVIARPVSCEYLPVSELLSADRSDESIGRG